MKQVFLDLETTGTQVGRHGVRQISALMEVPGEPAIVFDATIRLPTSYAWDSWVVENMASPNDYTDSPPMKEVFKSFKEFLEEYVDPYNRKDKYFLYAYNAKFDEKFLRQFFYDNGDKYFGSWFFTPSIDVMTLAAERLKEVRHKMPNFKLETVANILGLDVREAKLHDALYDIELTRKVYKQLTSNEQTD